MHTCSEIGVCAYTILPQIMAREFISFQQLFTQATKHLLVADSHAVYYL